MERLHLHLYLDIASDYSDADLVKYFRGTIVEDPSSPYYNPDDRFAAAGVRMDFFLNAAHGTADFKRSLLDDGSVVVYLGHSSLDFKHMRSLGLSPLGLTNEIPAIALMDLIKGSRAKLVILATCGSSTLGLEQLKGGPAVVVTNSGSNLKTWSNDWGLALKHFLHALIGYKILPDGQPYSVETTAKLLTGAVGAGVTGALASKLVGRSARATIREALKASVLGFKENNSTDRFELAHGEGSMVVFPDKE